MEEYINYLNEYQKILDEKIDEYITTSKVTRDDTLHDEIKIIWSPDKKISPSFDRLEKYALEEYNYKNEKINSLLKAIFYYGDYYKDDLYDRLNNTDPCDFKTIIRDIIAFTIAITERQYDEENNLIDDE